MQLKKVTNSLNKVMQDRHSVRVYDETHKIEREVLKQILQDAMTAPSSLNMQPWRFVVIDTKEGKEIIKPYMKFNTRQWETSSAIVAVFGDLENFEYLDKVYSSNVEFGFMTKEVKDDFVEKLKGYRASATREDMMQVVLQDCGYVGMQFMLAAKAYGYDTNPIGGYDKQELSKALGIDTKRYIPTVLFSIGKANEPSHDSTRFSVDDITQWR